MSTMEERATYGRIVHIGPSDERGRVTVTFDDGTTMILDLNDLPDVEQKPTDRASMLSDDDMVRECWDENACGERSYWTETAEEVRDYYENLIDKGVLRVAKKVDIGPALIFDIPRTNNHGMIYTYDAVMPCCAYPVTQDDAWHLWDFCPGCGSEIVKP